MNSTVARQCISRVMSVWVQSSHQRWDISFHFIITFFFKNNVKEEKKMAETFG
jgi:hypothetical protein